MAEKGHRQIFKTGDEADATSCRARRIVTFRRGALRKIKRATNKRARRGAEAATAREKRVRALGSWLHPDIARPDQY
jgi:hypothetical protein